MVWKMQGIWNVSFHKLIYRFNAIKILSEFFVDINKLVLKLIWKEEKLSTAKMILEKKIKLENLYYFFLKL